MASSDREGSKAPAMCGMMDLANIARALGGVVSGHQVLAPGPNHSAHDRSLAVSLAPNSPDLFRVHSFANEDWRQCRDFVKAKLGIADNHRQWPRQARETAIHPQADDTARTGRALSIWADARHLRGTSGLAYLSSRGIDVDALPDVHHALRWHDRCPYDRGTQGSIVALFTDILTGQPKGIHRIALTPAGEKIGKKMLGPVAGCVIRLWSDDSVTEGLTLGESVETTLAAATRIQHHGTHLAPAWAAGSAAAMAKFPVLGGIECLTLLVDNDTSGAGQKAAADCSARWTAAGREVTRLVPNVAGDFADIAKGAA